MPHASDRQYQWPRYAGRARQRTEETAADYGEMAQQIIELLRSIEKEAYDNPALVRELAIYAQRDAALIKAALADIHSWMVQAARGRAKNEESNGA